MDWTTILVALNDLLTAAVGMTALALGLYLAIYNRRSAVARTFVALLGCVVIVYLADILLGGTHDPRRVALLLRLQWLGIAFTPTLYLNFTRAIRLSVRRDRFPSSLRFFSFAFSLVVFLLALFTDLVVYDGQLSGTTPHLRPGPLFYPFAFLYAAATLWGLYQTNAARRRCHTRAARRRMAYLSIGFLAPALGVFPYLLIIGWTAALPGWMLWLLLILGNVAVGTMIALVAYGVAFIGALTPDRVIKHRLVRFLLRGPAAAMLALLAFHLGHYLEGRWELGRDTLALALLVITFIVAQLAIELGKPVLDLALYREGRREVERIQTLSQRLLTAADLRQFLENVLAAFCEVLRGEAGFIAVLEAGQPQREIWCGRPIEAEEIAALPLPQGDEARQGPFIFANGYWLAPIYDKSGKEMLGLLGILHPQVARPPSDEGGAMLEQLLRQAGAALDDRRLQQIVLAAFSPILPELAEIQRRSGMLRYEARDAGDFSLIESEELPQWVHDALAHYWGGPRLTENPLLKLKIVRQAAEARGESPVNGLRLILTEAIERLRPDGERKLTAPEWLLYNILEMKFLRGQKVREVAMRLAMSESDFYRKQRIAIRNLARIIAEMEAEAHEGQPKEK